MNDFREFSKAYNDYLQHGLPYAEDYIYHHGVKGMHWGIRRYQNPDGSLTAEGKARYGTQENFEKYQNTIQKGTSAGTAVAGPLGGMIGGAIATHKANKQLKEDMKKKDKNEIEGQPKKLDPEAEKRKQQYIQKQNKQIAEAKKIDLEKVRNSFKTDEMKDKWQKAVETDKFDIDFLERAREDWEELASGTENEEAIEGLRRLFAGKRIKTFSRICFRKIRNHIKTRKGGETVWIWKQAWR